MTEAQIAITVGCETATRAGWAVAIAVVDDSGFPVMLARMDGASPVSVDTAIEKARSAALTGLETRVLEDIIRERPGVATMKRVAVEGGVPIRWSGQRVGGIGVSGVLSDQDAVIANAALEALQPLIASHNPIRQ